MNGTNRLTAERRISTLPNVLERCKSSWININGIRWTAQFITGHGYFKTFKTRCGFCTNLLCSCGEEDSPEHVLTNCEKYNSIREKFKRENNTQLASERELMENVKEVTEALEQNLGYLIQSRLISFRTNICNKPTKRWYQI